MQNEGLIICFNFVSFSPSYNYTYIWNVVAGEGNYSFTPLFGKVVFLK